MTPARQTAGTHFARVAWEHPARHSLAGCDGHEMKCGVGDHTGGGTSTETQPPPTLGRFAPLQGTFRKLF